MKAVFYTIAVLALGITAARADSDDAFTQQQVHATALVSSIKLQQQTLPLDTSAYGSISAGPALTSITLPSDGLVAGIDVSPGMRVTAGQMLARIAPSAQSVADLRKAEDSVSAAQANDAHTQALLAARLATGADLANADQALRDAKATLEAAKATGVGVVRSIVAPADGVILTISATAGSQQAAGAVLFTFAPANHLSATIGVPESEAGAIQPGAPAKLTLLNSGATLAATAVQNGMALDPQTGLVDITLAISGTAMIGEPVSAVIQTGSVTGFPVPRDAVQTDENGDYVFQIDAENIAHRETAHILGNSGDETVLAPTLDPSLPLVTTGAYQLDDGMAVRTDGAAN